MSRDRQIRLVQCHLLRGRHVIGRGGEHFPILSTTYLGRYTAEYAVDIVITITTTVHR